MNTNIYGYPHNVVSKTMRPVLIQLKNLILNLIFPPFCFGCGKEGSFFCDKCCAMLCWMPPACFVCGRLSPIVTPGRTCLLCRKKTAIYGFISPFTYERDHLPDTFSRVRAGEGMQFSQERTIRILIHQFKYMRISGLGNLSAKFLIEYMKKYTVVFGGHVAIVPIPLHKSRMRMRGFNQAEYIAEGLARELSIRLLSGALLRVKKTKPQVGLSSEERKNNIAGVFAVHDSSLLRGLSIILVDDVKTTGATLEEAASVLKKAGAKRIIAVTLAH